MTASATSCWYVPRWPPWLRWAGWPVLEARRRAVVAVGAIALVAGLAEPLTFSVRNHPNQTVYFNAFTSGPQGASGKFDLDTWENCLLQAEQHVASLAREAGMRVVIPGHRWRMIGLNATRLPELVVDESGGARYHLEILLVHGTPEEIGIMASVGLVAAVTTADGAVLCTVVAGPAFQELANRRATGPD